MSENSSPETLKIHVVGWRRRGSLRRWRPHCCPSRSCCSFSISLHLLLRMQCRISSCAPAQLLHSSNTNMLKEQYPHHKTHKTRETRELFAPPVPALADGPRVRCASATSTSAIMIIGRWNARGASVVSTSRLYEERERALT